MPRQSNHHLSAGIPCCSLRSAPGTSAAVNSTVTRAGLDWQYLSLVLGCTRPYNVRFLSFNFEKLTAVVRSDLWFQFHAR